MSFSSPEVPLSLTQPEGERLSSYKEATALPDIRGNGNLGLKWICENTEPKMTKVGDTHRHYHANIAGLLNHGVLKWIGEIKINGVVVDNLNYDWDGSENYHDFTIDTDGGNTTVATSLRVYFGTEAQTADSILNAFHGGQTHPAYRGQVLFVFQNLYGGDGTFRVPNVTIQFRTTAEFTHSATTYGADAFAQGCNPVNILHHLVTHPRAGLGLDQDTAFDMADMVTKHLAINTQANATYGEAQRGYVSPQLTKQRKAKDWIKELLSYLDGFITLKEGQLTMDWYPHDVVTEASPSQFTTIYQADLVDKPDINLPVWENTISSVAIDYIDIQKGSRQTSLTINSQHGKTVLGEDRTEHITRDWFWYRNQVQSYGERYLSAKENPGYSGSLPIKRDRAINPDNGNVSDDRRNLPFLPGHQFRLNYAPYSVQVLCRVTAINPRGNVWEVEFTQERGVYPEDYVLTADPVPDLTPPTPDALDNWALLNLPFELTGTQRSAVGIFAERFTKGIISWDITFNDSDTWVSEEAYLTEQVSFAARVTASELVANAAGPTTFEVAGSASNVDFSDLMQSLDDKQAENNELLLFMGGEIMSIGDIALVSGSSYDITCKRGRYGSTIAEHASTTVGWIIRRADLVIWHHETFDLIFVSGVYNVALATKYFKILTRNFFQSGTWSASQSLILNDKAPAVPADLTATGIVGGITVNWTASTEADVANGGWTWIERADDAGFTVNTDVFKTPPDGEKTIMALTPGNLYYIRVRHQDSSGNYSAWSSGVSAAALADIAVVPDFSPYGHIGAISNVAFHLNVDGDGVTDAESIGISGTEWSHPDVFVHGGKVRIYPTTYIDIGLTTASNQTYYLAADPLTSADAYTGLELATFPNVDGLNRIFPVLPAFFDESTQQWVWRLIDQLSFLYPLPTDKDLVLLAKVTKLPGIANKQIIESYVTPLEKPIELDLEFPTITAMKAADFSPIPDQAPVRVKALPKMYYDSASTATPDDVLIFQPTTGGGRILRADVVTVKSKQAGAVADGSTNDTLKIQAAFDSGAKVIVFEKGDHLVTAQTDTVEAITVTGVSDLEIIFEPGARIISDNAANSIEALVIEGANDDTHTYSYSNLASNAAKGDKTLVLAVGEGVNFAAGDWCKLVSDGLLDGPMGAISKKKGELVQVRSVATDTLTLETGLHDGYLTSDLAKVAVSPMVSNITIRGLATDTIWRSLICRWVHNLTIDGSLISNQVGTSGCGIAINDCVGVTITNTKLNKCAYYGIQIDRSSRDVLVDGVSGYDCRHVVTTLANDTYGQVRNLTVRNGWANNCTLSAWDTHEAGEHVTFENLYSMEDGDHGIQVRAFRFTAINCLIEKTNADSYSVEYEVGTEILFINCKSRLAGRDGFASKGIDTQFIDCDALDSTNRGFRLAGGRIRGGSAERNASAAVNYNNNATRGPVLIDGLYAPKATGQTTFLAGGDALNLDLGAITVTNCMIPGYAVASLFASNTGSAPHHSGNHLFQDSTKTQGIATLTNGEVAVALTGLIIDDDGGTWHRPVVPNIQITPIDGDYPVISFASTDVDLANDWIENTSFEDYYSRGTALKFTQGTDVIGGLTDNTTYYIAMNSDIVSGYLRLTEQHQLSLLNGGWTSALNGADSTATVDDSTDFIVGRYAVFQNGSGFRAYYIVSKPSGTTVELRTTTVGNESILFADNEPVYLNSLNITSAAGTSHLLSPTGADGNSPCSVAGMSNGVGFRIKSTGVLETGRKVRWQIDY